MDIRVAYNAAQKLADIGELDLANSLFDFADTLPVPDEIKGGTRLARLSAEDAIDSAIQKGGAA